MPLQGREAVLPSSFAFGMGEHGMRDSLRSLVAELVRREIPYELACREFERIFLEEVMAAHQGNQSAAAKRLGIHRNTLSKKLLTAGCACRKERAAS